MSDLNEENYHNFLHEIKNLAIDMQDIKEIVKGLTIDERITKLEERMNILLLENAKLKLILEDVCHLVSLEDTNKHKTRKKS